MLVITVTKGGQRYRLPSGLAGNSFDRLEKGLNEVFGPIADAHPESDLYMNWNEDSPAGKLTFETESDAIRSKVQEALPTFLP